MKAVMVSERDGIAFSLSSLKDNQLFESKFNSSLSENFSFSYLNDIFVFCLRHKLSLSTFRVLEFIHAQFDLVFQTLKVMKH